MSAEPSQVHEHITLENEDVKTEMVADPEPGEPQKSYQIAFCDEHQQDLLHALSSRRVCTQPNLLKASHTLFTIASRSIGTIELVKHRCPVCALLKFNYIEQTAILIAGA